MPRDKMMAGWRKASAVLAGFVLSAGPAAAVDVGGPVSSNTVWDIGGSPYVVVSDVHVLPSVVLTIDCGVSVFLREQADILVSGKLSAIGCENGPVVFTRAPGASSGGCLVFTGTDFDLQATGVLHHCSFSYLAGAEGAVAADLASLDVSGCSFSNVTTTVLRPVRSRIRVLGNTFGNTGEAINAVRCAGLIASNTISGINGYADAIDLDFVWPGPGDDSMTVEWNIVCDGPHADADGIDLSMSDGIVRNNIIRNFGDKGISIGEGSNPDVRNNLTDNCNIGVAVKDGSDPMLAHMTIVNCVYGIRSYEKVPGTGGGRGSLLNSIVAHCGTNIELLNGSVLDVSYSCIDADAAWPGMGNICGDPQFIDVAGENLRLLGGSPCVNAGTNLAWSGTALDLDAGRRLADGTVDMGAYEFAPGPLCCYARVEPGAGIPPLEPVFTAVVRGTNTESLYYRWDLEDDGAADFVGTGASVVTGLYEEVGYYSVSLWVSNAVGETASVSYPDMVLLFPAVMYVSPAGGYRFPYESWEAAARDIQTALDASADGVTILVTNGYYTGSSQIIVTGGVTLEAVNGPEHTVIDARGSGRCLYVSHPDAVVEGFTITGGAVAGNGGGIYCRGATVRNCIVSNNSVLGGGTGDDGGGVFCDVGSVVENCVIVDNLCAGDGGGVYCRDGALVRNCVLENNTAHDDGGGAQSGDNGISGGVLRNLSVFGNSADDKGGGIFVWPGGSVQSCTISGNEANLGGGLGARDGGSIENSIIYGNNARSDGEEYFEVGTGMTYSHSCAAPLLAGEGNIADPPMFKDAVQDDYSLLPGSPCVDAGLNQPWMAGALDLSGADRIVGGQVDIGAYEFRQQIARGIMLILR